MPLPRPSALFRPLLAALIPALLLLTACAKVETNVERGNREQLLYVGIGTEPEALDPHIVSSVSANYVLIALLEGLVTRDPETLGIEPGVAESWTVSEDGLRYTFKFDPEARWSNGDRVRPEHFLFSFERILSPELGGPYAYMLFPVRGARAFNEGELEDFSEIGFHAPDPRTLVIELAEPTPYFLSLLTHFTWWPVHPPTVLAHGAMTDRVSDWTKAENFVGNGPFALESWVLNDSIVVGRNPHYREADGIRLNGIHFLPIESVDTEERAFRSGFLHLSHSVPIHRIEWYENNRPENVRFDTYLGTYYYALNTREGVLSDPRIRKALAYSIDREAITEHVLRAGQKPAYHFTPPNTGGYSAKARFPHDPDLARELLARAGYPGGEDFPALDLLYNTSESHRTLALAIQQMWKEELGIEVGLLNQEWKAYLATRKAGDFDILRAGWIGDYDDPHSFLSLLLSDSGNNHSGWSNDRYDALIAEAEAAGAPERRFELFQRAEALLIDEMPIIPVYFYVRSLLIRQSVRGWHPNVLDYHPYNEVYLEPSNAD